MKFQNTIRRESPSASLPDWAFTARLAEGQKQKSKGGGDGEDTADSG